MQQAKSSDFVFVENQAFSCKEPKEDEAVMRKLGIITIFLMLLVVLTGANGCDFKRQSGEVTLSSQRLQIEASVFSETPMLGAPIDYPYYTVLLKLSNRGNKPFLFDKIEITWRPSTGKVLTGVSTPGDTGGIFQIKPGETKEYWESSGDRTVFLLRDVDEKPLQFEVKLLHRGNLVFGPVSAPLPDIASLRDIHADGPTAGSPLVFSEVLL